MFVKAVRQRIAGCQLPRVIQRMLLIKSNAPSSRLTRNSSNLRSDLMDNGKHVEQTLDRLISVAVDSENRYRHANLDSSRERVARFFAAKADARKKMVDELEAERESLGIHKREHGTLGGVLKRIEMEINVQMSMGDTGIVEWCRKEADDVIDEY